ncbi:uncharacterized protein LOC106880589 [Octopus bimaculoides]|uniref:Uncharacterized protein n=1 Tax=Octopus bimaculoides TaxID=37653 RepID=A0A0L8FX63_OCTBM|nr:uncharacterized protein LOC106880589 [Octopus bimaculoides]|eukprot:XP_014786079.1 PREDICTED: uncharacterized protein LOC106880589 [Octopus bimaculoides]
MLGLPFWSILVIIFPCLLFTQATMWNMTLCSLKEFNSVRISLDKVEYVNISSKKAQKCFNTEFELDNTTKPGFAEFDNSDVDGVSVQNDDLQEMYFGKCGKTFCNDTIIKLMKMVPWTIEVIRSEPNDDHNYSFESWFYGHTNITFRRNSRTSNTSFFIPMDWNQITRITFYGEGNFWLGTAVKLQNMDNYKIYSCIFIPYLFNVLYYHRCFLTNDSTWKIELSSQSKQIEDIRRMKLFVGMAGRKSDSSLTRNQTLLKFQKLAYLPTISAVTNIPNISISEVEIDFKGTKKPFKISKIVMTKWLTGEEYGCVKLHNTNAWKYSCEVLKSKNWLLKVISPEEHERIFSIEIIQDTLSSFTRHLKWDSFGTYGNNYIKYFNLKTYENGDITNINLHFQNKTLKINEISLIRNYSEYKFKRNEDSNTHNSSVTGFSRTTKDEIHFNETTVVNKTDEINFNETIVIYKTDIINCNKTILIMQIVIGLLAVTILILLVLLIRFKMLGNKKGKSYMPMPQVAAEDKMCYSMQNTNSVCVDEPGQE